ncbi:hypothetical protein BX666DRAFT_2027110 [Dichotomocladium elegans]|nr:hypothetical protein BX666DRAFT_2027110 [Dichotomocladium elegans]
MASFSSDSESWSDVLALSDDEHAWTQQYHGWEKVELGSTGSSWFVSTADSFMGIIDAIKTALQGDLERIVSSQSAAIISSTEKNGYADPGHGNLEDHVPATSRPPPRATFSDDTLANSQRTLTGSTTVTEEEIFRIPDQIAIEQEATLPSDFYPINPKVAAAVNSPETTMFSSKGLQSAQTNAPAVLVTTVHATSTAMPGSYPSIGYNNHINYGNLGAIGVYPSSAAGIAPLPIGSSLSLCAVLLMILSRI